LDIVKDTAKPLAVFERKVVRVIIWEVKVNAN
jgi:hypothetical protein